MTTLHNPLISGFHPDPSVVAVDGAYYLATSTSFTGRVIGIYAVGGEVAVRRWIAEGHDE